ncbi:MAG TPA: type II toxin-antitoxin system HipA family toxin [Chthoniobacterales bacterium]|nr:type II toxin-antitoxin system HipA family toxin [Chthoniobacterales bacterium]
MTIEVYINWKKESLLVGRLYTSERNPSTSFEYASEWIQRSDAFAIDPTSLPLRTGPHHAASLFGVFQDCGPDRWGRLLIERAARKGLRSDPLRQDIDYVLALEDNSRIGALRFSLGKKGAFLADSAGKVPPLLSIGALLNAANAVHEETETAEDLRYLLALGSPLGGARPKSAVSLKDEQLAIAKFPKPDDIRDIAAGEILALTLAKQAGINVAEHRLLSVRGKSVSIITRFDRKGEERIPFLSGNTLLGLTQNDPGAYTLLADGIRQFGDNIDADLQEMWRRLVFSLLASNYDDHLRNHGFLMLRAGRWSLSPAYDLNPVPETERSRTPKTPITEDLSSSSIAMALDAAPRFALTRTEAKNILKEVLHVILGWKDVGRKLGIKASTLHAYASAFENPLIEEAKQL